MNRQRGFGQPKSLPGQAGYRMSETEILEKESREMESRLRLLQEKMQSSVDEPKPGGARWRSARTDKGSITSYEKDVQEKVKKKAGTIPSDAMASSRQIERVEKQRKKTERDDYRNNTVASWTVGDVGEWLKSLSLDAYEETFKANEISGTVLLDLSLEDLDYMGITVLGHRKIILKGVEELRHISKPSISFPKINGQPSPPVQLRSMTTDDYGKTPSVSGGSRESLMSKSYNAPINNGSDAPAIKTHWSHLEPLSMKKISGSQGTINVNAADSGGREEEGEEVLDEEAEREAFRRAVMEWRGMGIDSSSKKKEGNEGETHRAGVTTGTVGEGREREIVCTPSVDDDGLQDSRISFSSPPDARMWHNPALISHPPSQDRQRTDRDNSTDNTSSSGNVAPSPRKVRLFASGEDKLQLSSQPSRSSGAIKSNNSQRGSRLGDGFLNEEKEHEAFVRAVHEWRSGRAGSALGRRGGGVGIATVVEKLKRTMEAEEYAYAEKLEKAKAEARFRLELLGLGAAESESSGGVDSVRLGEKINDVCGGAELEYADEEEDEYYFEDIGHGSSSLEAKQAHEVVGDFEQGNVYPTQHKAQPSVKGNNIDERAPSVTFTSTAAIASGTNDDSPTRARVTVALIETSPLSEYQRYNQDDSTEYIVEECDD